MRHALCCPRCGDLYLRRRHLPFYLRPLRPIFHVRAYRCYTCDRRLILAWKDAHRRLDGPDEKVPAATERALPLRRLFRVASVGLVPACVVAFLALQHHDLPHAAILPTVPPQRPAKVSLRTTVPERIVREHHEKVRLQATATTRVRALSGSKAERTTVQRIQARRARAARVATRRVSRTYAAAIVPAVNQIDHAHTYMIWTAAAGNRAYFRLAWADAQTAVDDMQRAQQDIATLRPRRPLAQIHRVLTRAVARCARAAYLARDGASRADIRAIGTALQLDERGIDELTRAQQQLHELQR